MDTVSGLNGDLPTIFLDTISECDLIWNKDVSADTTKLKISS